MFWKGPPIDNERWGPVIRFPEAGSEFKRDTSSSWNADTVRSERLGLRRLVRACSKSVRLFNEHTQTVESSDEEERDLDEFEQYRQYDSKNFHTEAILNFKDLKIDNTVQKSKRSAVVGKAERNKSEDKKRRILVMDRFPLGAGVNNILSQVCGGPLERVVYHDTDTPRMELTFVFPEQAANFYTHATKTGLFTVNGKSARVRWADIFNTENITSEHPKVSSSLMREIIYQGSRRTLILSQIIPNKVNRSPKKLFYPDPSEHYSPTLDIVDIRADFSVYGDVIDLGPVISRKLCFSIHFSDIESAILAKRDCETPGTEMNKKYSTWSLWFAKDVTDKPCPVI